MTKEQALELAYRAGFQKFLKPIDRPEMICDPDALERFATLVGNAKLEQDAKKCEYTGPQGNPLASINQAFAQEIRNLKEPTT